MRSRMISSVGMRSVSLDNLASYELESIDSMPISVLSDTSSGTSQSVLKKIGLTKQKSSTSDICEGNPKDAVIKILKTIKQLNNVQTKDINIMSFMEMLQMQFYKNVSMSLLKDFMKCHKMIPKPVYFHYFVYFLHYAEYYHFTRGTIDIIDPNKVDFHLDHLRQIRAQIKYIYRIINKKAPTEITL